MADSYSVTVEVSGIMDGIALALANGDRCNVTITGSGSYIGNGSFYVPSTSVLNIRSENPVYIDNLNFLNSGILNLADFNISTLNISGYSSTKLSNISGSIITCSGLSTLSINDSQINNSLFVQDTELVNIINTNSIGNGLYKFININQMVKITSGDYSNYNGVDDKLKFSLCSGVYIDHIKAANTSGTFLGLYGCINYNINHSTLAANVANYNIIKLTSSGGYNTSGNILNSIVVGSGNSSNGPILFSDANQYMYSSLSCLYNFNKLTSYTNISGSYMNMDPMFVNATSGDLRLDVNSPCACAADPIENVLSSVVTDIIPTPIDPSAVKFFELDGIIRTPQPATTYVAGNGKAIFLKSDPSLINNIYIEINKQYEVTGSGTTVQSFKGNTQINKSYSNDYKLIPFVEKITNETKYYVIPYTIFDYDYILNSMNAKLQSIDISGKFKLKGFTRDRFTLNDGTPIYWIGEEYNNFLYGFSSIDNAKKLTYPLFPLYSDPLSVPITNLTTTAGYVTTDKVYINDHFETRDIAVSINDSTFQFISYEQDTTKKVEAMCSMGDWLVVLNSEYLTNIQTKKHDLTLYNKYDNSLFIKPIVNMSGVIGLDNVNIGDLTFTDDGKLLVSVSGYINTYNFYYDYALATRTPGTIKTTLLFREQYANGVDI